MPSETRQRKIADLIKRDLAAIVARDINDPRLHGLLICDVEMTPDLGTAKVFYIVEDDSQLKEVEKGLSKAMGFMRRKLAASIKLRYTPKLLFIYDKSIHRGAHLSYLIDQIEIDADALEAGDDDE